MIDLFDWQPPYPRKPGYKENETSKDAAKAVQPRVAVLRERIKLLLADKPLTTDETADLLGVSILSVRPRFSEIYKLGEIEKTPMRRKNASGVLARVWRLKD